MMNKGDTAWVLIATALVMLMAPAVLITIAFSLTGTFLLFKLTRLITRGVRVKEEIEIKGIDVAYHKEKSFS